MAGTQTFLIINGAENRPHSEGNLNKAMAETAAETLAPYGTVLTTNIIEGYDVEEEIAKYKQADIIIYQYPVFWFMVPSTLKKYMDDVFAYDAFFSYTDGPYGSGGLMHGKKVMFSTTWNAPIKAFNDKDGFFEGMTPSEAIFAMSKAHQYCGMAELEHFSSHNVVRDPQLKQMQSQFAAHLQRVIGSETVEAAA